MGATTHLLYLHGFRSSPQSTKARIVAAWLARSRPELVWHCPQLPPSPAQALHGVLAHVAPWPRETMGVIGSSLGGFYATLVAEQMRCRAVLLNPAVDPARDLACYVGEIDSWHSDERFDFRTEFVEELRELSPRRAAPSGLIPLGGDTAGALGLSCQPTALTDPERYLAIIAKGDEVLSWREMAARYAGCRIKLLEGSDHALSDFELHLPDLLRFLGLA
jgi:predicted esterase YcpF (UPF0227 family)